MPVNTATQKPLGSFGRAIALLFNRAMMYQPNHPVVEQAIDQFHAAAVELTRSVSPLVFILNREEFFVDEEPLDPRINVSRLVTLFKNHGLQSISIEPGLERREVKAFMESFAHLSTYNGAEGFQKALFSRGVNAIKVNHVRYRKVTADDEVIAKDALKELTTQILETDDEAHSRKMFMDTLLESVLTDAIAKTLNIQTLMTDPGKVSSNMIQTDLAGVDAGSGAATGGGGAAAGEGGGYGSLLTRQLEAMRSEVEKHLAQGGDLPLSDLAGALFEMKKQLLEGIEAQKALGVAYGNEAAIVQNANALTDRVLLELVREEYRQGRITPARMAQLLRRLVPEAAELKRLLPTIKTALLAEGMNPADYLEMVRALHNELQNEGLGNLLQESGEAIGVDGEELIDAFRRDPEQAARLIYLAAEIRKGAGDHHLLADLLADYVEQMGGRLAMDQAQGEEDPGHLKQVVGRIESDIVRQLKKMEMGDDVIATLETRLNARMEAMLDQLRIEWLKARSAAVQGGGAPAKALSVLATLEQSVGENDDLYAILQIVRSKVAAGQIDENDYKAIQDEITLQKRLIAERESNRSMPAGVIKAGPMAFILEKEIARANRYDYTFSVLAFSILRIKPRQKVPPGTITLELLVERVLDLLSHTCRDVDIIGQLGKNTMVAVLPLIDEAAAGKALNRVMKAIHETPVEVGGVLVELSFAGAAIGFDGQRSPTPKGFLQEIASRLQNRVNRLKTVQSYL